MIVSFNPPSRNWMFVIPCEVLGETTYHPQLPFPIRAGSEREDGPICKKVVHGAYPVIEKDGLLFAYLGPSELRPPFPVFDTQADYGVEKVPFSLSAPCNWLQIYENTQDPVHVVHLHSNVSGIQFGVASGVDQIIEYQDSPLGMITAVIAKEIGRAHV